MRYLFWTIFGTLASWSLPTAARNVDLAPSSKWIVNYAPDSCTLARSFGANDATVIVQFVKYKQGSEFELNLRGDLINSWRREPRLGVRFGASGDFIYQVLRKVVLDADPKKLAGISLVSARFDNRDPKRIIWQNATRKSRNEWLYVDPAVESAVDSISFVGGDLEIRLAVGLMRAPLAALNKCTLELVASWGLDPAVMASLALPPDPIGTPDDWFAQFGERKMQTTSTTIRYRLMIDEKGVPTNCALPSALGQKTMIDAMCNHLKRNVRFWPAETKDGVAVPAYYVGSVAYFFG